MRGYAWADKAMGPLRSESISDFVSTHAWNRIYEAVVLMGPRRGPLLVESIVESLTDAVVLTKAEPMEGGQTARM